MPTFKLGGKFRLQVGDGATPTEAFANLGGEGSLKFGGNSDSIDLSSKDDGLYKSMAMGQQAATFTLDGVCNTPDTALTRLDAVAKTGAPVNIKVIDNTGAVRTAFAGSVFVGNRNVDMSNNQAVKYSFTLSLNGAPTTDAFFG